MQKLQKEMSYKQTNRQKDGHVIAKGYNFLLSRGPKSQNEK